jgi:hypothetical protein
MTQTLRVKDIEHYTREELLEIAGNDYGVDFFPDAKNPSKPSKQEIADLVNTMHSEMINPSLRVKKSASRRKKDLLVLKRVIVTEMRTIESYENDDENRCVFITWGNDDVKHHTTRVVFNTPWHIPVGCLNNLKNVEYTPVGNNGASVSYGATRKAYKIEELDYLNPSEIKDIANTQKLRTSAE